MIQQYNNYTCTTNMKKKFVSKQCVFVLIVQELLLYNINCYE